MNRLDSAVGAMSYPALSRGACSSQPRCAGAAATPARGAVTSAILPSACGQVTMKSMGAHAYRWVLGVGVAIALGVTTAARGTES